jgi:predicted ribosome quality control (RQC) complex YloA/Tae2 family protein
MIANYYTLRYLSHDLHTQLAGAVLCEVYCQNKDELLLTFETGHSKQTVVCLCHPASNALYLRPEVKRARKNSIDIFPVTFGILVREVSIAPADRELRFTLDSGHCIAFQAYGSKANVVLTDKQGSLLGSFLPSREGRSESGRLVRVEHTPRFPRDAEEVRSQLRGIGNLLLPAALKQVYPLFGTPLVRELCFRSGLSEQQMVAELTDKDIRRVFEMSAHLLSELEKPPTPRIYYEEETPILFSPIPLQLMQGYRLQSFSSIHEAIRIFLGTIHKQRTFFQQTESLLQFLRRGIEKAERTLEKMAEEATSLERAVKYESYGKLLMTNLGVIQKGMKHVQLENIFDPQRGQVTIALEPHLTPARNAERYFEKAKKARASMREKSEKREEIEERWQLMRRLLESASGLRTTEHHAEFIAAHAEELVRIGWKALQTPKTAADVPPFREFTVEGGFIVWAGKSSENNDLLTMTYAKPNDLWFHARGSSGSHVVLRAGTGKGEPSKRAIEQAAAIAAYYSKMKNARNVPVAVTLRKYVRKPKGAPAGTVTIEREKLLFVDPALPFSS